MDEFQDSFDPQIPPVRPRWTLLACGIALADLVLFLFLVSGFLFPSRTLLAEEQIARVAFYDDSAKLSPVINRAPEPIIKASAIPRAPELAPVSAPVVTAQALEPQPEP